MVLCSVHARTITKMLCSYGREELSRQIKEPYAYCHSLVQRRRVSLALFKTRGFPTFKHSDIRCCFFFFFFALILYFITSWLIFRLHLHRAWNFS